MIAQLVSFFLPQNSYNSATTSCCCHTNKNIVTESSELDQVLNSPLEQIKYKDSRPDQIIGPSTELPHSSVVSHFSEEHPVNSQQLWANENP